jgi:HopA1 effector protein family
MTVSTDRYASQTGSNDSATRLEQVLQDIVNKIAIQSDFSIVHPEYGSIELAEELQARFGQMPDHVQNSYLQVKLQQFLYHNYYSLPRLTEEGENNEKMENQAIKWSKSEFLEQLRQNNHSQSHFESGWLIIGQTDEGLLQVKKDDLTLHIGSRHLQDLDQSAQVGDIVAVKMRPQLVEQGFYIAVGTAGSINHLAQESDTQIVDIYLNLSSEGAVALMDSLTIELNGIEIPFHFKVLYRPEDYIVCNTAVLSFERHNYKRVQPIVETVYQNNQSYFQPEIPLFSKYLAPGLSLAERPNSESLLPDFAPNRCQIIAQALILAWREGQKSPEVKLKYICDRFSEAGIDLKRPYLNPNSKDIY